MVKSTLYLPDMSFAFTIIHLSKDVYLENFRYTNSCVAVQQVAVAVAVAVPVAVAGAIAVAVANMKVAVAIAVASSQ